MIKFGVAGNSESFYNEGFLDTIDAAKWCSDRNIDMFEYSCGRGVRVSKTTAQAIGKEFAKYNIELSVHAPYFINLANQEEEKIINSFHHVTESIKLLQAFGNGNRIVVHPASQGKLSREEAVNITKENLKKLSEIIYENNMDNFLICLETMGKLAQIGDLKEIVSFCNLDKFYYPCIDFGHLYARTIGGIKNKQDYIDILEFMKDNLPKEKFENMHVHFSKIMYGQKGEIKHLTFDNTEYGPDFEPLAELLVEYNLSPKIICESAGTQAEDTIAMKNLYLSKLK
ncbi:MAG: TIM barrel protein [Clostridia bacterium]|nr:TIM barrel protein [Clostridia bacterium]